MHVPLKREGVGRPRYPHTRPQMRGIQADEASIACDAPILTAAMKRILVLLTFQTNGVASRQVVDSV